MMIDKSPRDFLTPWPSHNVEFRHLFGSKDSKWGIGDQVCSDITEVIPGVLLSATTLALLG